MFPASTNGGGTAMTPGPTDVCKTPTPAGPTPMPYPNIVQVSQASGGTCSSKVKFAGKKACTVDTEITMSSGDEAGTAGGGLVSSKFKGPAKYKQGCSKVLVEGKKAVHNLSMISMNGGQNGNMPAGTQTAPSQTKVVFMSP
jgi:hypothetical protein